MHKLAETPITIDCFELDDYNDMYIDKINDIIIYLENLRQKYNETQDKKYWKELIRWLPEGWMQTRTVTMSYENLFAICSKGQRRNHKLTEWSESFMNFARSLPYSQEFIFIDEIRK